MYKELGFCYSIAGVFIGLAIYFQLVSHDTIVLMLGVIIGSALTLPVSSLHWHYSNKFDTQPVSNKVQPKVRISQPKSNEEVYGDFTVGSVDE